jgi:hypothetical protein
MIRETDGSKCGNRTHYCREALRLTKRHIFKHRVGSQTNSSSSAFSRLCYTWKLLFSMKVTVRQICSPQFCVVCCVLGPSFLSAAEGGHLGWWRPYISSTPTHSLGLKDLNQNKSIIAIYLLPSTCIYFTASGQEALKFKLIECKETAVKSASIVWDTAEFARPIIEITPL